MPTMLLFLSDAIRVLCQIFHLNNHSKSSKPIIAKQPRKMCLLSLRQYFCRFLVSINTHYLFEKSVNGLSAITDRTNFNPLPRVSRNRPRVSR